MPTRIQTHAVAKFSCLGDRCPDTCCKGWGMQLSRETVELYQSKAPELVDAVTSGEAEFVMKRDAQTDYCVKFDQGWCAIHRDYGPEFLGDACYFYPRVTRALDDTVVTTLALSCPEAARLMLSGEAPAEFEPRSDLRLPFMLRNYLPAEIGAEEALVIHQRFLEAAGEGSPEHAILRLMAVARALEAQPGASWAQATPFYFSIAESRIPAAQPDANDLLHLAQGFAGLLFSGTAAPRAGLAQIAQTIEAALGIRTDPATRVLTVAPDSMQRGVKLLHRWREAGPALQPLLRRYLQAQLSQALFPFAGLGGTPTQRLLIIAVRFATLKLALMAHALDAPLDEAEAVRITYTLSRFLDHLADPTLSLAIYEETGWVRDARLRALLGD